MEEINEKIECLIDHLRKQSSPLLCVSVYGKRHVSINVRGREWYTLWPEDIGTVLVE